jgi:hypothetical protein
MIALVAVEGNWRSGKKRLMRVPGELNSRGLPQPIPAAELQVMLGPNPAFCSWDASIRKVSEEMARWPFFLSRHQVPKQKAPR